MNDDMKTAWLSRLSEQAHVPKHEVALSRQQSSTQGANFVPEDASLDIRSIKDGVSSPILAKSLFDFTVSVLLLMFMSPLYLVIALAVKLTDRGSIFYSHKRIGLGGHEFGCLKFRTMVSNGDEVLAAHLRNDSKARAEWLKSRKLRYDPRVTPIGRMLRKLSLDELPQLINVLRGEMSLVGPRPVMSEELAYYGVRKHLYFQVRPGITGLWQVSGRSDLSYKERVEYDCEYVENWSFKRDIALILRTIPAVCSGKGSC
ncbi:sugar transferase [Aureimonas sp. Leaf454]|uniref:sugar transferase n=1 Tax=Aureimonas sp. Leaf454 TaxID=1736381 RepID=UPI001FCD5A85|nr:sugar transferase [Aureimonas sp. Leaf454]